MRDSEVVAAIVAGDPGGLAEAYDKYAAPLYAYCRSLLREPADAADVVQDTFVIAAGRLAGLRDQNRLRPWLYAVARNECYRRTRTTAAHPTASLDTMPDVTDATADASGEASRAELRALLRSAVRGLKASDQDLIELQIRQGLDVAEIAAMLGVSRNHTHAMLSRARDQLETSLGALLVARTGRGDCAVLSAMLEGWNGQLTVLTRKRLNRHIERCPVCAERKRRELAPALLLGLAPLAALPIAPMPAGLRGHVLKLASSDTPEAVAHRAIVAQRTTFGHTGFPKPLDPPKTPWWRTRQGRVTAGGVAAAAVAAAVIGVALAVGGPGHHPGQAALARGPTPASSGVVSASGPATPSQRPHPSVPAGGVVPSSPGPGVGGSPSPTAGGAAGAVAPSGSGSGSGSGSSSGSSSPSASRSAKSSAPPSPGLTLTPEPSSGVTMGPNSPAPSTTPPPSASSSSPPPAPGTLGVSPTSVLLSVGSSATLTLTASNGPVNWSIMESQALIGGLTVSPSSGTLASGSSTTVTVTANDLLTVGGQLTVQPGGITVSVVLSLNLGAPAPGPGGSPGSGGSPGLADLPVRNGAW
jgi:RNA polymerase sigma factor (sigma-70 family)